MSGWKKYEGTDDQIAEMMGAEYGFIFKDINSEQCNLIKESTQFMGRHHLARHLKDCDVTHYLICFPHPLADMIIRQVQTGQPVWIKEYFKFSVEPSDYKVNMTTTPNWNIPGAEYRFTPFEDDK